MTTAWQYDDHLNIDPLLFKVGDPKSRRLTTWLTRNPIYIRRFPSELDTTAQFFKTPNRLRDAA
jgi:hypothetical protein